MTKSVARREADIDLLRQLICYDPLTGILRWLERRPEHYEGRDLVRTRDNLANNFNARFAGKVAGSIQKGGYRSVKIFGVSYLCHRVAFALTEGRWPASEIDHENGRTADNRWPNLRDIAHGENCKNQRRAGAKTSGIVGVDFHAHSEKWRARITAEGKTITIGSYTSKDKAAAARKAAERQYGFHPNHGRASA